MNGTGKIPGPGDYDLTQTSLKSNLGKMSWRLQTQNSTMTPGPGSYNVNK